MVSSELEQSSEDVACDFCGARDAAVVWAGLPDRDIAAEEAFTIVRCRRCRLVYLNPRPTYEHIGRYYSPDYLPHAPDLFPPARGLLKGALRRIARSPFDRRYPGSTAVVPPPYPGASLLDVGCGAGGYLASMAELGWDVYGIEPSPTAADLARARLGDNARVFVGRADAMSLPPARYDYITLWHVLEHVHSPTAVLEAVAPALRSGGSLRIAVPNIGSAEARVFGRRWSPLEVPRHLFHFDSDTLAAYLMKAGFKTVSIRPQWFPSSISDSINYVIEDIAHRRYRRPDHWMTYYGVASWASLVYVLGNSGVIDVTSVRAGE
jgi:2-polyprenyl-3-methyl-5-hydroxy-6-metoxy-1,4-benzoquinol methylase